VLAPRSLGRAGTPWERPGVGALVTDDSTAQADLVSYGFISLSDYGDCGSLTDQYLNWG
jgi:hypothetical protein